MGLILLIESGRQSVKEMEPTWAIVSKGLKYFFVSFLEGQVVQMLLDLMKSVVEKGQSGTDLSEIHRQSSI